MTGGDLPEVRSGTLYQDAKAALTDFGHWPHIGTKTSVAVGACVEVVQFGISQLRL